MSWIAAGVAVGTTLYGANRASKASKDASKAQSQSADQASKVQWDMFNQSRKDQEPFRQAGLTGLGEYMALLGLQAPAETANNSPQNAAAYLQANPDVAADPWASKHPWEHFTGTGQGEGRTWGSAGGGSPSTTQADAFARFRNQPGYQFGLDEGSKALQTSAAASGGLFSGKAGKALTKFGQDYADQQGFSPYMNRLASLSGIGQTATNNIGSLGQNTANQVGNNLMNAGNARASGIQNSANIWGQAAGQLGGLAGYMYGNKGGSGWGWGGV